MKHGFQITAAITSLISLAALVAESHAQTKPTTRTLQNDATPAATETVRADLSPVPAFETKPQERTSPETAEDPVRQGQTPAAVKSSNTNSSKEGKPAFKPAVTPKQSRPHGTKQSPRGLPEPTDDCAEAPSIPEVEDLPFDTTGASHDGPGSCVSGANVWVKHTVAYTGVLYVGICDSNFDTMLGVYEGSSCVPLGTLLACNDDSCGAQSEISLNVVAGDEILIEIGGYGGYSGTGTLDINCTPDSIGACCFNTTCSIESELICNQMGGDYLGNGTVCDPNPCAVGACCIHMVGCEVHNESDCLALEGDYQGHGTNCDINPCPPFNDSCYDAMPIGDVIDYPFDTTNSTSDLASGICPTFKNIWYCYTASSTGTLYIGTCDSDYDTILAVYDGCGCSTTMFQKMIGCNNDSCGQHAEVWVEVLKGHQYMIEVGGFNGNTGTGLLDIICTEGAQGACCYGSNGCTIDYELACVVDGGTYLGDGTACSGLDCQPNGVDDACDIGVGTSADCNTNGIPDECDISSGYSNDGDNNGVPDECQPDCNENGIIDACDVDCGHADCLSVYPACVDLCDCQSDGVPDECQLTAEESGPCEDCIHDDGSSESAYGLFRGGEIAWIHHCTTPGLLTGICTVWGTAEDEAGVEPGDPVRVYVWDDPVGNGDLADAVFIAEGNGFADEGSIRTDIFQEIPIGPIAVGESYFIGASAVHAEGTYPNAADNNGPCEHPYQAWQGYVGQGAYNPNYPAGSAMSPGPMSLNWLLRATVQRMDPDCNDNAIPDECEIAPLCTAGESCFPATCLDDCQADGIPDTCQLENNDCNENGIPDTCDIADGDSLDCQMDGIPDDCQLIDNDCDLNGIPDECDDDCNHNGIIDGCDVDCSVGDCLSRYPACETTCDCQQDGVPDECQLGEDSEAAGLAWGSDESGPGEAVWFELDTPETLNVIAEHGATRFLGAGDFGPEGYEYMYVENAGDLCKLYTADGHLEVVNTLSVRQTYTGMAWDDTRGVMWATSTNCSGTSWLHVINLETAEVTDVGGMLSSCIISLAVNCNGDLYAHDMGSNTFGSVDPHTGIYTEIGPTGFTANYGQGMEFDPRDGTCYMTAFNAITDQAELRTVNIATGATTLIGPLGTPSVSQLGYLAIAASCNASTDCNDNQIPDACEVAPLCVVGEPCFPDECREDCQQDGIPDFCQLDGNDCNENGYPDDCDIAGEYSQDCQADGVPDECQLSGNDCNNNNVPDECDITSEYSQDCQSDGIPDECQLEGNDCDSNGIPDECAPDCDGNGIIDFCDINCTAGCEVCYGTNCGQACDCNDNETPDECETTGEPCGRIIHDNGECDGEDGTMPSVGWDDTGMLLDFTLSPDSRPIEFSCVHLEMINFAQTDMTNMRVRIYRLPTNDIPTDLSSFAAANPIFDHTYAVENGELVITQRAECYPDTLAWDYDASGPSFTFAPGSYAALVTFPGFGDVVNFWASAPAMNGYAYTWGAQCDAPLLGNMGLAFRLSGRPGNDCNNNGIPDECDTTLCDPGAACFPPECSMDDNTNGTPDECDLPGDFDGNGALNENDIPGFVEALLAGNDAILADINNDGSVDGHDIQQFVIDLLGR